MSGKDSTKRAHEVFERLQQLGQSQTVSVAQAFHGAGFSVQVGRCYLHSGQRDFKTIELIASHTTECDQYLLSVSWHVAIASGESDLLVVITGTSNDAGDTVAGFRPLANLQGQALLPLLRQTYTGIGLLDAPRIMGHCLEDALQPDAIGSHNQQALMRALNSAYQTSIEPPARSGNLPPHYKIAAPLLVSSRDLYEANLGSDGVESDDSCFLGLEVGVNQSHDNQLVVDIINPDFVPTYTRMAAELAEQLPRLIDQHQPPAAPAQDPTDAGFPPPLRPQSQIDAWERFRDL